METINSSYSPTISSFLAKLEKTRINRWVSDDRRFIYEWDHLHGEIEVYNQRGSALSILYPDGTFKKLAKHGRKIDV